VLENRYGASNVTSTTIPPIDASNAGLAGARHSSGIVFDARGLPIFDDVALFDTKIAAGSFRAASYRGQMRMATRELRAAIARGEVRASQFTAKQLRQIRGGRAKIDNFTWHHHQDFGRMQLVPTDTHSATAHVGNALSQGL
jgi:filamentous hemagglutinin